MTDAAAALALMTALALAAPAVAQEPAPVPAPAPTAPPIGAAQGQADPLAPITTDVFDLVRAWRKKPPPPDPPPGEYSGLMTAIAPVITYGPTTGAGLGVAGNAAFYRGPPETTKISSVVASAIVTTRKQLLFTAKVDALSHRNARRFTADGRFYDTSQETFGLGTGTSEDAALNQKFNFIRSYETVYQRIAPSTYVGGGFLYNLHTDVHPDDDTELSEWDGSPYIAYSLQHGFDPTSQTSSGMAVHGLFDSRDGAINPTRGWYAQLSYLMFFKDLFGGSSNWQQVSWDARAYRRLTADGRHKLAVWAYGDLIVDGTAPYLDLPATGMDTYNRSGRGYPQGRFRGERLVYGEAEYRWTFTRSGLLGMVAFLNTQTVSDKGGDQKLFDAFEPAGGAGLRLALNKRSRTNLCLDLGFGSGGSKALYFAVQEAF